MPKIFVNFFAKKRVILYVKIFTLALFCCGNFAFAEDIWRHENSWWLAKDERAKMLVRPRGEGEEWGPLELAWTHYDGHNLILFMWYKNYVKQYVLKLEHKLNYARALALPDFAIPQSDRSEFFIKFADFKGAKAKIEVFITDKNARLDIDFLNE